MTVLAEHRGLPPADISCIFIRYRKSQIRLYVTLNIVMRLDPMDWTAMTLWTGHKGPYGWAIIKDNVAKPSMA